MIIIDNNLYCIYVATADCRNSLNANWTNVFTGEIVVNDALLQISWAA